jgi:hypothetical protein
MRHKRLYATDTCTGTQVQVQVSVDEVFTPVD